MAAQRIDGKQRALEVREGLRERIARVKAMRGRPPGLAVLLVGDDPGSQIYVRNKEKAALELGFASRVVRLSAEATQEQILAAVDALNKDADVDAFIVQLPLPRGIDEALVVGRVAAHKDADGLHPDNLGKLLCGIKAPRPCTPSGVMELLRASGVSLMGRHAVVIGRSNIVGKPVALMLLEQHATVTLCHSRTPNLAQEVGRADIVVAAVGVPNLIQGVWLKPGAVVIDVGINRVNDKVVGDVDFAEAQQTASLITPVPGGVGPMTIAMLLANAVAAAERMLDQKSAGR